jgi:DNA repair protein RecO (recombination protein O)
MRRTLTSDTIILKNTPFGEIHKNVTMFTREYGLLHAIAYGALKGTGKLRSLTSPFAFGTVYLYNEPVKGSYKITDMDVKEFFEGVRQNLRKFFAASLWAEIVLYSHGGGESSHALFGFLLEAMRHLERLENEQDVPYSTIQFIWQYLKLMGARPQTDTCVRCDRAIQDSEDAEYSRTETGFLCRECSAGTGDLTLGSGSRRYLAHTAELPFDRAVGFRLGPVSLGRIRQLMFRLAEDATERELNTLKSGEGLL